MRIGQVLDETVVVSTAAESLDYLYDKTKNSGDKAFYMLKKIINSWFTEIHSRLGTGATSHKDINKLSSLINYAQLYVKAKNKNDEKTADYARRIYEKLIKEVKSKFGLKEATARDIIEKQKGFAYQLKKRGKKYYIYHAGKSKKAYSKGVLDLNKLPIIVRPWLSATSVSFKKWGPKLQRKIINKYIEQLKKTLEE